MERFKDYVNKKFIYKKDTFIIKEFKKIAGNFVVKTTGKSYAFYELEIDKFLNDLKPYKMENSTTLTKESKYNINEQDLIKQMLFDAINKVKDDRNYVAQANAICNITSQLINIKKLELKK